jgi:hypothetical protein
MAVSKSTPEQQFWVLNVLHLDVGTRLAVLESAGSGGDKPSSTASSKLTSRAIPQITWPDPAPVAWTPGGFSLGEPQLNATVLPADLELTYTPPEGERLDVGPRTLRVDSVETDAYAAASKTVALTVTPATPRITWNPPDRTVAWKPGGFVLEGSVLNATFDPEGIERIYDPAEGQTLDIGQRTLFVRTVATPNYVEATGSISLTVAPIAATISIEAPGTITWRPGLTVAAVMPKASVTPPEAGLDIKPALSTVLGVGDVTVTAEVLDTTHYVATPGTVTLKVGRATPSVLWEAPDPQDYVDGGFKLTKTQLNAAASPGAGAPTYTSAEGKALGVGTHKLVVVFAESATHLSVTKDVEFEVRKGRPTIVWSPPQAVDFTTGGFKLTTTELSATTTSPTGLALTFTPAENAPLNAGTHELKAVVTDAANYAAEPATVTLAVRKAKPVITWAAPAIELLTGTDFTLTDGKAPLTAVLTQGESKLTYRPAAASVLKPGTKGGATKNNPHPPLQPKTYIITAVHAESANYAYAETTMAFTIAPSANAKKGFEIANTGGVPSFKPTETLDATVKDAWDKDTGNLKTQATKIISDLPNMTGEEIIEYMDKLADVANTPGNYQTDEIDTSGPTPKNKMYYNKCWKLPNGLQVRLKPNGDPFTNPHLQNPPKTGTPPPTIPMFAVEIRKPSAFDFAGGGTDDFSSDDSNTATKVTAGGNLGPWGPRQTTQDGLSGDDLQQFTDATTQATHHQCRATKKDQVIVCADTVTIPHGTKLNATALGVRLQPGNGDITFDSPIDTVLPVGTKSVKITAAASKGFNVAAKTISVVVEKAKPRLTWKPPADVDYVAGGFVLTDTQLNATLTPAIPNLPDYTPALGGTLDAGTRTLRADVAANAERELATATVSLVVNKAAPVITPKNDARRQEPVPGQGVVLAVDDVVQSVAPQGLAVTLDPPAGTMLPAGSYRVQARVAGNANVRAAAIETSFIVTAGTV